MSRSRARLLVLAQRASRRVIRRAADDHCTTELVREADVVATVLWRRYWVREEAE